MGKFFSKIISLILFLYVVVSSYQLRWVSDDAFISFRYARNFVNGLGLVFNEGEKVEGYTNFLWTIIMAIPHYFEIDPVAFSEILGILFFLGTLATLIVFSNRNREVLQYFPVAFAGLSLHKYSHIFATSGLETSMFTFLVTAGFLTLHFSKKILFVGGAFFLLVLAVMTRMDGIIFYLVASAFYFIRLTIFEKAFGKNFSRVIRGFLFAQIPFIALLIPYWIIKSMYYGSFFPNTYYAKSANASYFSQGLKYFWLYFNSYYVFYLVPFLLLWLVFQNKKKSTQQKDASQVEKGSLSLKWLILPAVLGYIFYVVKVGGDFMFSRFFIPVTPLLFILLEILISEISRNSGRLFIGLSFSIAASTILFFNPYRGKPIPIVEGISNESEIYRRESVEKLTEKLKAWRNIFVESKIKIAFGGAQAIFAYYTESPLAIEAETGLTDYYIAHLPLEKRGRIGHEKRAPLFYLKARGVHIHLNPPEELNSPDYKTIRIKAFPGYWKIINPDVNVMRNLSKQGDFSFE
ncbi:MAG: hypothetical protein IT569_07040 [Leptospiraceae bacterium]|nr:hypothetical protein [Leptospiraceae bacterium]